MQASKKPAINFAHNTAHLNNCQEDTHSCLKLESVLRNTTVSIISVLKPALILFLSQVNRAMKRLIPVKISWWNVARADTGRVVIVNHFDTFRFIKRCQVPGLNSAPQSTYKKLHHLVERILPAAAAQGTLRCPSSGRPTACPGGLVQAPIDGKIQGEKLQIGFQICQ